MAKTIKFLISGLSLFIFSCNGFLISREPVFAPSPPEMPRQTPVRIAENIEPSPVIIPVSAAPSVISTPEIPSTPAPTVAPVPKPEMLKVDGGTFMMGSDEPDAFYYEKPGHPVTVSGFYIGVYEVTQKDYRDLLEINPSVFKGDSLPVETVSWFDAVKYCNARSKKENLAAAYKEETGELLDASGNVTADITKVKGYRLPTEAEWEFAARGGKKAPLLTSNKYSGSNEPDRVAVYNTSKSSEVGSKTANELGLYDMSGNVWEWCTDWFGIYSPAQAVNPYQAQKTNPYRTVRGGSWNFDALYARTASRGAYAPSDSNSNLGFRLARSF